MTKRIHFHFSLSCIGEGNGNPLQCSCLENPSDGGAWWAAVYGVAQSQTRLKWLSSSSSSKLTDNQGKRGNYVNNNPHHQKRSNTAIHQRNIFKKQYLETFLNLFIDYSICSIQFHKHPLAARHYTWCQGFKDNQNIIPIFTNVI